MDRKAYTFLVEVLYEQIVVSEVDSQSVRRTAIAVQSYQFTDDNRDTAFHEATKEMDNIRRNGMKMAGGAIIKSIITPSAIKQIGIVDLNAWEVESQAMEEAASAEAPAEEPQSEE